MLQPRVTPSLPTGREGSLFQRVFSGPGGMDPYAFAVSDVYQDLFGEGSYSGKGIYDVDAFEAALEGRIPENTLLSHDLLEGIFARAGLVSDIEVVEDYPVALRRRRGAPASLGARRLAAAALDLRPRLACDTARPAAREIPWIGRWKMLDNLRRTLSRRPHSWRSSAGWMLPLPAALIWSGFVLATLAIPTLMPLLVGLVPRRLGISKRSHLRAVGADLALALSQIGFGITLLAHQAWLMTDAIVRTLFRLLVTRTADARVGHRRAGEPRAATRSARLYRGWQAASRWPPLAATARRMAAGHRRPG